MECRGPQKRRQIVCDYDVKPLAHLPLLAGQTKRSDAEATIKNEYYIFEAVHKTNGKIDLIQCGMPVAKDFLGLLHHDDIPLFNPLCGHSDEERGNRGSGTGVSRMQEQWHPAARQLYNAIMWLIIIWDAKPGTALFEFESDIVKYKNVEPFGGKVKRVNTAIRNGGKGRTLTEMIGDLRENNDIRDDVCRFDLLIDILKKYRDKEGKTIPVQSFF